MIECVHLMKIPTFITLFLLLLFGVGHFSHGVSMSHEGVPREASSSQCVQTCFDVLDHGFFQFSSFPNLSTGKFLFLPVLFFLFVFSFFDYFYKIRKRPLVQKVFSGVDGTILRE